MPAKCYRKKAVEVEAVQWTGENIEEIRSLIEPDMPTLRDGELWLGFFSVARGDFIVRCANGKEHLAESSFHATYEPVETRKPVSAGEVRGILKGRETPIEAAHKALAEFEETGDYEAPVQALRDLLGIDAASQSDAPSVDNQFQPGPVEEGQSFEDISLLTATWGNGGKLRALTVKTPEGTVRLIPEPVEEESEVGQARHALKCWPPHFEHVLTGQKTFEVRSIADHTFEVGDTLLLREYDGVLKHRAPETEGYTGRTCKRTITYILGDGDWGIDKGTVVLALAHSQHSTEEGEAGEKLRRGVAALVATTYCLKRPKYKHEPWDGPCGKCAPCLAKEAVANYDAATPESEEGS